MLCLLFTRHNRVHASCRYPMVTHLFRSELLRIFQVFSPHISHSSLSKYAALSAFLSLDLWMVSHRLRFLVFLWHHGSLYAFFSVKTHNICVSCKEKSCTLCGFFVNKVKPSSLRITVIFWLFFTPQPVWLQPPPNYRLLDVSGTVLPKYPCELPCFVISHGAEQWQHNATPICDFK